MNPRIPADVIFLRPEDAPTLQGQLAAAVVRAILETRARPGTRLPSSRKLAQQLRISRMTVTLVYQELVSRAIFRPCRDRAWRWPRPFRIAGCAPQTRCRASLGRCIGISGCPIRTRRGG